MVFNGVHPGWDHTWNNKNNKRIFRFFINLWYRDINWDTAPERVKTMVEYNETSESEGHGPNLFLLCNVGTLTLI